VGNWLSKGRFQSEKQSMFRFSIRGDELADGPFYNYARCSAWSDLCSEIVLAYANSRPFPLKQASPVPNTTPMDIDTRTTEVEFDKIHRTESHQVLRDPMVDTFVDEGHLRRNLSDFARLD